MLTCAEKWKLVNKNMNKTIKISTTIFTDQNRTFDYSQSTTSNSNEFIVPLSTDGAIPGDLIQ